MAFVRSAVLALGPRQREAALADAGIDAAALALPFARVPAAAFARLWIVVAGLLDDEFFGLDARRMKVGTFAMLCHALASQTAVGPALRLALRGFGLCFDDIAVSLCIGGGAAGLVIDNRITGRRDQAGSAAAADPAERADARRFADETLLVMLHGLLCWLVGRRVLLTRLDWAHPRPAHAKEYRRMFSPLQRFDALSTAIWFDARLLQAAVVVTPAGLKAFLRDAPQSVFLKQVLATGLSDQARRMCRGALDRGDAAPTLAMLSRTLDLSAATLRRRLEDEGASWGQLKDEVRRELAMQHLADGRLSVGQIADRLGFNDASTFYRAFRKWTGSAPGAWRSAALSGAGSEVAAALAALRAG
jgi:AraC-like DNA-binding protein